MRVGDLREEKFVYFGGLQSLAAAGAEHCPIGLGGAEGPDALQGCIRTSIAGIDLEGCSPLQPRDQNIVPDSTAPRDRTPSRAASGLR